jgi:Flp pilus assembly protein TadD
MPRASLLSMLLVTMLCTGAVGASASSLEEARRLQREGQPAAALVAAEQALAGGQRSPEMRFTYGVLLSENGRDDEARTAFESLTRDYPDMPEPHNNLGVLLSQRGEHAKARDALESAIRANPRFAVAHENLGDIYVVLAAQAYRRSIEIDPQQSTAAPKLDLARELLTRRPMGAGAQITPRARPAS